MESVPVRSGLEMQLLTLEDMYEEALRTGTEQGLLACAMCYQLVPLCNCRHTVGVYWPIDHVINKLVIELA